MRFLFFFLHSNYASYSRKEIQKTFLTAKIPSECFIHLIIIKIANAFKLRLNFVINQKRRYHRSHAPNFITIRSLNLKRVIQKQKFTRRVVKFIFVSQTLYRSLIRKL